MTNPKRRNISQRSELIYDAHNFGILEDAREIFLTPCPEESWENAEINFWVARNIAINIRTLNLLNNNPILIHQYTCGGHWNYGMAIYDTIRASVESEGGSPIVMIAYAHARSMSSITLQAANLRVVSENCDFLIHYGSMGYEGNLRSYLSEGDWAKKGIDTMLNIYVGRCKSAKYWQDEGMGETDIKKWLIEQIDRKQEFYMTAKEAVEKGFADGILGITDGFDTIELIKENAKNLD